jgi:Na+/citrate or Na+/malate symporter
LRHFARLLTVISVAGAAVSLWQARIWQRLRDWRTPRVFSWVILAGVFASVFLPALVYHARGGGLHQRYLFGALYIWTLLFAVGFTWTKQNLAPIAGYCATFLLCYSLHVTYAALIVRRVKTFPIEQALGNAAKQPDAFTPWLMVGLTLGFVGVIYALAQLHRPLADSA